MLPSPQGYSTMISLTTTTTHWWYRRQGSHLAHGSRRLWWCSPRRHSLWATTPSFLPCGPTLCSAHSVIQAAQPPWKLCHRSAAPPRHTGSQWWSVHRRGRCYLSVLNRRCPLVTSNLLSAKQNITEWVLREVRCLWSHCTSFSLVTAINLNTAHCQPCQPSASDTAMSLMISESRHPHS
eukprot:SAG11_NODE_283_length_11241_cov_8.234428_11_plen_180_part_00